MQETITTYYRWQVLHRNSALALIACWLWFGTEAVRSIYINVDGVYPDPLFFAMVIGFIYLCMMLVFVHQILLYLRHRLIVDRDTIWQIGVFWDHQIVLADATSLQWRWAFGSGMACLTTPTRSITIHFSGFEQRQREQLIGFLRATVDVDRQSGWEAFLQATTDQRVNNRYFAVLVPLIIILPASVAFFYPELGVYWPIMPLIVAVPLLLFPLLRNRLWRAARRKRAGRTV